VGFLAWRSDPNVLNEKTYNTVGGTTAVRHIWKLCPAFHPPTLGPGFSSLPSDPKLSLRHILGEKFMLQDFDIAVALYSAVLHGLSNVPEEDEKEEEEEGNESYINSSSMEAADTQALLQDTQKAMAEVINNLQDAVMMNKNPCIWVPAWWTGHTATHTIVGTLITVLAALDKFMETSAALRLALGLVVDTCLPLVFWITSQTGPEACSDWEIRNRRGGGGVKDAWPCASNPLTPPNAWSLPDIYDVTVSALATCCSGIRLPFRKDEEGERVGEDCEHPPIPQHHTWAADMLSCAIPGPGAFSHVYKTIQASTFRGTTLTWFLEIPWLRATILASLLGNYPGSRGQVPVIERIRLCALLHPYGLNTAGFFKWAQTHEVLITMTLLEAVEFMVKRHPGVREFLCTYLRWQDWVGIHLQRLEIMRVKARILSCCGRLPTYCLTLSKNTKRTFLPKYAVSRSALHRAACSKQLGVKEAKEFTKDRKQELKLLKLFVSTTASCTPMSHGDICWLLRMCGANECDIIYYTNMVDNSVYLARADAHAYLGMVSPFIGAVIDAIRTTSREYRLVITELPEGYKTRQEAALRKRYKLEAETTELPRCLTELQYCRRCQRVCSIPHVTSNLQWIAAGGHDPPGMWITTQQVSMHLCDECGGDGCEGCGRYGYERVCMATVDIPFMKPRSPCRMPVDSISLLGRSVQLFGKIYALCPSVDCGRFFMVEKGTLLCPTCLYAKTRPPKPPLSPPLPNCVVCGVPIKPENHPGAITVVNETTREQRLVTLCWVHRKGGIVPGQVYAEWTLAQHIKHLPGGNNKPSRCRHLLDGHATELLTQTPPTGLFAELRGIVNFPT